MEFLLWYEGACLATPEAQTAWTPYGPSEPSLSGKMLLRRQVGLVLDVVLVSLMAPAAVLGGVSRAAMTSCEFSRAEVLLRSEMRERRGGQERAKKEVETGRRDKEKSVTEKASRT